MRNYKKKIVTYEQLKETENSIKLKVTEKKLFSLKNKYFYVI